MGWPPKSREEIKQNRKACTYRWRDNHPGAHAIYCRNRHSRDRDAALRAYGSVCACCGESRTVFLCIDHINGGGNTHRRSLQNGRTGGSINHWLKRQGWPEGFQVLCRNCNWAKSHGGCPHVKVEEYLEPEEKAGSNDPNGAGSARSDGK